MDEIIVSSASQLMTSNPIPMLIETSQHLGFVQILAKWIGEISRTRSGGYVVASETNCCLDDSYDTSGLKESSKNSIG